MAVVVETTLGDITIDLYIKERPRACMNFLKLCKMKYYNFNLFHTVNRGFIAQTGDPSGSRDGGESIWGVLDGPLKRYYEAEALPRIKHTVAGLVSFVGTGEKMLGSQFFVTLAPDLTYLDEQHCVFGQVVEGQDVLDILNEAICDNEHRPYKDIRITHTVVLDDPFPDPEGLSPPNMSPDATAERLQGGRIAPDEEVDEAEGKTIEEISEMAAEREAKARATILEMVGDIPDADIAPPENVLFVCKLNPVTNDDDLEIIFSRFGRIKSCEVIRDKKSGDSLQYAFVEFEEQKACEDAYFKMDNVLIDDRRIHVDFSQSVAKVKWLGKGRLVHYGDKGDRGRGRNDIGNGRYKAEKTSRDDEKPSRRDDAKKTTKNDRDRTVRAKSEEASPPRRRSSSIGTAKTESWSKNRGAKDGKPSRRRSSSGESPRASDDDATNKSKTKRSRDDRSRDRHWSNQRDDSSYRRNRYDPSRSDYRNRYQSRSDDYYQSNRGSRNYSNFSRYRGGETSAWGRPRGGYRGGGGSNRYEAKRFNRDDYGGQRGQRYYEDYTDRCRRPVEHASRPRQRSAEVAEERKPSKDKRKPKSNKKHKKKKTKRDTSSSSSSRNGKKNSSSSSSSSDSSSDSDRKSKNKTKKKKKKKK